MHAGIPPPRDQAGTPRGPGRHPPGPGHPPTRQAPPDQAPPWDQTGTPRTRQAPPWTSPPPEPPPGAEHTGRYGQRAGGMHPTGMQSCSHICLDNICACFRGVFPNEEDPGGLHGEMFLPALENLADTQLKDKWMSKVYNFEIIGTYAQTEMGHGNH